MLQRSRVVLGRHGMAILELCAKASFGSKAVSDHCVQYCAAAKSRSNGHFGPQIDLKDRESSPKRASSLSALMRNESLRTVAGLCASLLTQFKRCRPSIYSSQIPSTA